MGMEYVVHFAGPAPSLSRVREKLADRGLKLGMRMVDGQLAFPDDEPPAEWGELRVALAKNMITLRRRPEGIAVVAWGNADEGMLIAWHAVTWGLAEVGLGTIEADGEMLTPQEFAQRHLPAV